MNPDRKPSSHFLDKQTFFALAFVFLAWIGWGKYMAKKYPKPTTSPYQQSEKQLSNSQEKPLSAVVKPPHQHQEPKTFHFENEYWKLDFSSVGMGLERVFLKRFFDREKKNIVFQPQTGQFLFEVLAIHQPLHFEIKQTKENQIQGIARVNQQTIKIDVDVHDYFLEYTLHFQPKILSSFSIRSFIFPDAEEKNWIQSLLSGMDRGLGFFAKNEQTSEQLFYSDDESQDIELRQLDVMGVGERYFGQAFVNRSDVIPSIHFQSKPSLWRSQIDYDLKDFRSISSLKYRVFFGPKSSKALEQTDNRLSFWIDFGFLRILANMILKFLQFGFSLTGNWGISIILLTLLIRLLLFPLNLYSYQSMKIMKKIQPEMKAIREKYKSDPKKMNAEVLTLMRNHNAKPLGGCLPMLLQFPVFFALYRVLGESFELYQAPFVWWVKDLSAKDPFYVIPILMGIAMYIQQKITPTNMDPAQEKVLRFLPILFTFFMISLPSGLTLYILISTLFALVQQYYFTKLST